MNDDDRHGDMAGIGKVAQAIPEEGWKKAIDTACDTFADLISPITSTTAGLGGLIQSKFDAMIDVQKVFAADAVHRARLKMENVDAPAASRPSARVIVSSLEEASMESDEALRDIWANLIANELSNGGVHPDFPHILSRLSRQDALVLAEIADASTNQKVRDLSEALVLAIDVASALPGASLLSKIAFDVKDSEQAIYDANREQLQRLALITHQDGKWSLTHFGVEFVAAVTSPTAPSATN